MSLANFHSLLNSHGKTFVNRLPHRAFLELWMQLSPKHFQCYLRRTHARVFKCLQAESRNIDKAATTWNPFKATTVSVRQPLYMSFVLVN